MTNWNEDFPKLRQATDEWLFGDIWERKGLSKRDRSLITVAMLTALYRHEQLPGHVNRALDNGVTKDELVEIITHATFYSGWPPACRARRSRRRSSSRAGCNLTLAAARPSPDKLERD